MPLCHSDNTGSIPVCHSICRSVTPTTRVRFPYVTTSADLSLRQHGFDSRLSLHLPICHSDTVDSIPDCHSICCSVTLTTRVRFPIVIPLDIYFVDCCL